MSDGRGAPGAAASVPAASVLVTRPEPGAGATARRLAALGLAPVLAPLLVVRPLAPALPAADALQAVLATSGNAVRALPANLHQLPLLAVGQATALEARRAGFVRVRIADGDAAALAGLTERCCEPAGRPLLLAAGENQGGGLAAALRRRGFAVELRAVYRAEAVAELPPPARAALAAGGLRAALFFSAETARVFVRLVLAAGLGEAVRSVAALALAAPVADALAGLPWRGVRVALSPNQDELLALLR